jgi:UDPglucose 6-dehydrogenase
MNIAIVGAGYVGLVAACCLAKSGHSVIAVEKDQPKMEILKKGKVPFYEDGMDEILKEALSKGNINFTSNLSLALQNASIIFIAVGTPALSDGRADLSQVFTVAEEIINNISRDIAVVMKSTVPPGTGKIICDRFFNNSRYPIHYVSNPEFLREGKSVWDWYHPDRIVIGCDDEGVAQKITDLYSDIDAPKEIMDVTSAEMVKYASNAFLATKISFINEIANLCELTGGDIDQVAHAVGMDSRIGHQFLQPGLGYGGSCFPKDTMGLDYISSFNGYRFSLLKAVVEVNARQRIEAIRKLNKLLGDLWGKRVTVLGLAFKPGTDDIREAPALEIIKYLADEGAIVRATDPMAMEKARPVLPLNTELFTDPYDALVGAEAVLLATEWPLFVNLDWATVKKQMNEPFVIIDGRNALNAHQLISLGYRYEGYGRSIRS